MDCVKCIYGSGGGRLEDWVSALPILWEQGECWMYVCVVVVSGEGVGRGLSLGRGFGPWSWRVLLCLYVL